MQSDLEDLIAARYKELGASTIKQLRVLIGDLNTIAQEKKKFVLGLPDVESNPILLTEINRAWPLVSSLTSVLAKDEHWEPSNFEKANIRTWMAKLNIDLAPVLLATQDEVVKSLGPAVAPYLEPPRQTILSQSADAAEVEFTFANLPPIKRIYQKIGNVWIDVKAMNELRLEVDKAKEQVAGGDEETVKAIRAGLGGLIAIVGSLARADTQEDFTQAVDLLKTTMGSLMPAGGPMGTAGNRGSEMGSGSMGSPYGGRGPPPSVYQYGSGTPKLGTGRDEDDDR